MEAFRSTLEEAKYADVILHVVDASNPQMDIQMHIVYETLDSLEAGDKKVITLFNKIDRQESGTEQILRDGRAERTLRISARTGEGLSKLRALLEEMLREDKKLLEKVFRYEDAGQIQLVRRFGELLTEEYQEDGIYVKAYVPEEIYQKVW